LSFIEICSLFFSSDRELLRLAESEGETESDSDLGVQSDTSSSDSGSNAASFSLKSSSEDFLDSDHPKSRSPKPHIKSLPTDHQESGHLTCSSLVASNTSVGNHPKTAADLLNVQCSANTQENSQRGNGLDLDLGEGVTLDEILSALSVDDSIPEGSCFEIVSIEKTPVSSGAFVENVEHINGKYTADPLEPLNTAVNSSSLVTGDDDCGANDGAQDGDEDESSDFVEDPDAAKELELMRQLGLPVSLGPQAGVQVWCNLNEI
jgi:hypothetical protein